MGRDILFIETDLPAFVREGKDWENMLALLAFLPVPVFGFAGFWFWERRHRRLGSDVALRRRLRAAREARAVLKRAGQASDTGSHAAGAGEALRTYLADRYNLPRAGLTPENVAAHLRADGVDPDPIQAFLDRSDAARFAPGAVNGDADNWLESARSRIDSLDRERGSGGR